MLELGLIEIANLQMIFGHLIQQLIPGRKKPVLKEKRGEMQLGLRIMEKGLLEQGAMELHSITIFLILSYLYKIIPNFKLPPFSLSSTISLRLLKPSRLAKYAFYCLWQLSL